jgi:class 3 adenylate cyclase/DNA-binding MarR family transcriptional regulator
MTEDAIGARPVRAWLDGLGLAGLAETFEHNDIGFDVLPDLTDADLRELGVSLGQRKRLLRAIDGLRAPEPAAGPAAPEPADRGERRQVTLSFFDLVGSTELGNRLDVEDMGDLLAAYHIACKAAILRYGGHVAHLMGDGVLASFGYPVAQENAAESAVRAALDAIAAVSALRGADGAPLAMRAGVATGVVVVGRLMGDVVGEELSAIGETPNLAARLQAAAGPGALLIAEATRRLVGEAFTVEAHPPLSLKGFSRPISAFRVLGLAGEADRFLVRHTGQIGRMVGRAAELSDLRARWLGSVDGKGRVVLVRGEAGIGKSRLVRALIEDIGANPHHRLRWFCSPYHANSPLWPVIDSLQRRMGMKPGDALGDRLGKLAGIVRTGPDRLPDALPLIADLLGLGEAAPLPEMPAQERRARTAAVLVDQIIASAEDMPTLLVVEDVHWLDPTSLELVTMLASRIAGARLMLLATARPGFAEPWRDAPGADAIELVRLGRESVDDIIRSVAGKALPPEIVAEIAAKTDGVPLFVEELTKTVLESDILRDEGGRYSVARPIAPLSIPSTLQDSLTARLDRLSTVKSLAQLAATIGRDFSYALLAESTDLPAAQIREALDRLVEARLVERLSPPPDERYLFTHALVRDAAYQSMLREQRRHCHAAIAGSLALSFPDIARAQPELVANHFDEADLPEEAAAWWAQAGRQSARRSATAEAARQLRAAIAANARIPQDRATRLAEIDLRVMLSGPLIALQGYVSDELESNYARAWELCEAEGERERAFPVLYGQWVIPYVRGQMEVATARGRQFLERAEAAGDATLRMVGHRLYGSGLTWLGDAVGGAAHLERALAMFDPALHDDLAYLYSQHPRVSARAHLCFAQQALGRFDAAAATAVAAVDEAGEKAHFNSLAYALCFSGLLFMLRRERAEVDWRARRLLAVATEKSASYWILWAETMLGWAQAASGETARGLAAMRAPMAALEEQQANVWLCQAQLAEAEMWAQAGDDDRAARSEAAAREMIVGQAQGYYLAELHRVSALRLSLSGAPAAEVTAALETGLGEVLGRGAAGHAVRLATMLAAHLRANGQGAAAARVLARIAAAPQDGAGTPDMREFTALRREMAQPA